jgi:hypothetical protein
VLYADDTPVDQMREVGGSFRNCHTVVKVIWLSRIAETLRQTYVFECARWCQVVRARLCVLHAFACVWQQWSKQVRGLALSQGWLACCIDCMRAE